MKNKDNVIRFAVGKRDDPCSSIWRLWSKGNSDLYLATRNGAHISKFSFHGSKKWRFAINQVVSSTDADRALEKWERPKDFIPGWTRCLSVLVPPRITRKPFLTTNSDGKIVEFVKPPKQDQKIVFSIIYSPKTTELDELIRLSSRVINVLGNLDLERERVWLISFEESFTKDEEVIVKDYFYKTKIQHESLVSSHGFEKSFLHVICPSPTEYSLIDIELGEENLKSV